MRLRPTAAMLDRLCARLTGNTFLPAFLVYKGPRPGGWLLAVYWGFECQRAQVRSRITLDAPTELQMLIAGPLKRLVKLPGTPAEIAAWLAPQMESALEKKKGRRDRASFAQAPASMRLAALTRLVKRLRPSVPKRPAKGRAT